MALRKFLAIDLGASSGRLMQAIFDGHTLQLSEVHRFYNEPVNVNDGLYWNSLGLFNEIQKGLKKATEDLIPIVSISVDTWGVDYVYLDEQGDLLYAPHCYRDNRMSQYEAQFYREISPLTLFQETGVQPAVYNTVLQLYADIQEKPYLKQVANKVLFMPDFINYLLSGVISNEYTIASTSGLLNIHQFDWSKTVFETLGIPLKWFSPITMNGAALRQLSPRICQTLHIDPFTVIAGAGHDTAAAVLTIPYEHEQPRAFISCGTWSLVGIESEQPLLSEEAFAAGITNEGCFDGHYRILKNTTGMWLVQELQRDWRLNGEEVSFAEMVNLAREVEDNHTWLNPNNSTLLSPYDMESKLLDLCRQSNQDVPQTKGHIVRMILESLAYAYRETVEQLEVLTGSKIEIIHMVGGGIQNTLLCQLTADVTKRQVVTGPIEASALGNIVAQMLTMKEVQDRAEAIRIIQASETTTVYTPQAENRYDAGYAQYKLLVKEGL